MLDTLTETCLHESPFEEPSRSVSVTKKVPKASSIVEATRLLNEFIQTWGATYPKLAEQLRLKKNLFSFMHFPKEIWASLYTNKLSEAFNKQIKRITTIKEQFPHEAT
ncbi:transposase [Facklamia sp. P12934]|uniref:transposase n=1 Tax=Facklamia sp. P12934 TaxID=3421948 RepID=UPI003D184C1D